jgi:type IX secretion system PorP/SprF family membrane protein
MKKYIIIFVMTFIGLSTMAQQDALFSQYMFNKLVINPAYAGTRNALSLTMVGRQQWVGLDGAPSTFTFTIHSPLKNDRVGLGFYCYTDAVGPVRTSGIIPTFSYKIRLGPGRLSFGLQVGIKHMTIDWTKVTMPQANDVAYMGQSGDNLIMDANFGMYYYTDDFYVGVSSKHLFEQEMGTLELEDGLVYATLLRHFYGMAGVAIPINENLVLEPSILVKYVKNAPVQIDLNANLLIYERFWLGFSYRTEKVAVFLAEVLIGNHMRIGYSYDIFLNQLKVTNRGSHEVLIGFDIPVFNRRMMTPRYF